MERKEQFEQDEFYHVYNRGVEKRKIFMDKRDYDRFINLLYVANSDTPVHLSNHHQGEPLMEIEKGEPLVAIGAWCLMPNHFHLLLTPLVKGGISKFMLKLQTGYSMYFNKKNDRVGSLFQGIFKSQHIDDDVYLRYIYAYIHLNPAKLKNSDWKKQPKVFLSQIKNFIIDYTYSSLQEYISKNYKIVNPQPFPVDEKEICDYNAIVDDFSEENTNYK